MANFDYSLLQKVYDQHITAGQPLQVYADGSDTGYTSNKLRYYINYFEDAGYIRRGRSNLGTYVLEITYTGVVFVENGFKAPSVNSNTTVTYHNHIENISNSPIAIGETANATQSIDNSIHQLREQIETSTSEDKEELHQVLNLLEMVLNNQVPIKQGLFSHFASVIQNNKWIISPIASSIIQWLMDNH